MTPWYHVLTELGDRGGETSIRRAALTIRANKFLLPEQHIVKITAAILVPVHPLNNIIITTESE